jgi:hypothetical protein
MDLPNSFYYFPFLITLWNQYPWFMSYITTNNILKAIARTHQYIFLIFTQSTIKHTNIFSFFLSQSIRFEKIEEQNKNLEGTMKRIDPQEINFDKARRLCGGYEPQTVYFFLRDPARF